MGSILARAEQIAALLDAGGVPATVDPAEAAAMRPCVLVTPPSIDYSALTNTWRLAALAGTSTGNRQALDQLDQLVQQVIELLPVEAADPAQYALTPEVGAVPAYLLRVVY